MKKLVLSSSALALSFATALSVPTAAAANHATAADLAAICAVVIAHPGPLPFPKTQAGCAAYAATAKPSKVCQALRKGGHLDNDPFNLNQGRCVSLITHYQNDLRKQQSQ